jgi:hypothetical protein
MNPTTTESKAFIDRLTPEQAALMPVYGARWVEIGLSTKPIDRQAVEAAIKLVYESHGMTVPKRIEYVASPRALILRICQLKGVEPTQENKTAAMQDVYTQHDMQWCAYHEFCREVLGLVDETEGVVGVVALARAAGWYAAYDDTVIVSERPAAIVRDKRGYATRLEYSDGFTCEVEGLKLQD